MLMLISTSATAQRRQRVFTSDPDSWISVGIAGFTANGVNDGGTASSWDFGGSTNWQYSLSLEKAVANGASLGFAGTFARVPFTYYGPAVPVGGAGASCTQCDAHLNMSTLAAVFHVGSGVGLHSVIDIGAGIVNYSALKRDADGVALAGGSNTDPFFTGGWGIGYGFDDRTQIEFTPEYAIGIHERSGLANRVSNTNGIRSIKITFRKGFGVRSLRR